MLTVEKVLQEKPEISRINAEAFIKFCICFDCLDSESYEEAKEKILISMGDVSREMEMTDNPEEHKEIMRRRYANLPRR